MPNILATLGILQLDKLNYLIKNKKKLHEYYNHNFKGLNFFDFDYYNFRNTIYNYWINLLIINSEIDSDYIINKFLNENIFLKKIWKPVNTLTPYQKYRSMNKSINANMHYSKYLQLPSSSFLI